MMLNQREAASSSSPPKLPGVDDGLVPAKLCIPSIFEPEILRFQSCAVVALRFTRVSSIQPCGAWMVWMVWPVSAQKGVCILIRLSEFHKKSVVTGCYIPGFQLYIFLGLDVERMCDYFN